MSEYSLDGHHLTRAQVMAIARDHAAVSLDSAALDKVDRAAQYVEETAISGKVTYGITTGFGKNSDVVLPNAEAAIELQKNLIISHAVCVGKPLSSELVRAIMVLRINTLLQGHSGIRRSTLKTLTDMLNSRVHPIVPEKGSVGASGDLAPLSHIALVMIGLGEAEFQGERMPGEKAMQLAGISPITLTYKEGLALNNTTAYMAGLGVFALDRMQRLLELADLAAAMSLEAMAGRGDAFDSRIHALRPHPGQQQVAANMRRLTEGSTLINIKAQAIPKLGGLWQWDAEKGVLEGGKSVSPQDSYSLRCVPQVHGAVRDTIEHTQAIFDRELSAVTDNPIIFPDDDCVISAGNFHGMPLALALAAMKNSLPVLGAISERRINKLLDASTNDGLPYFLVDNADSIQSGLMIIQYTAASLVNELATRSHSAVTHSIPTCANVEDHVSMGANEARHIVEMLDDLEHVLAFELLTAAQGLDIRLRILQGKYWPSPEEAHAKTQFEANVAAQYQAGKPVSAAFKKIRETIPYLEQDRELRLDIDKMLELIRSGQLSSI